MAKAVENFAKLAAERFSRTEDKLIQYGTAGFRTRGSDLLHVMYRMGALAVLRSKVKKAVIGVMITASHNPEEDNGVKLIDPMGEMLQASWEGHATYLANVKDEDLGTALNKIISTEGVDVNEPATVFLARDTRPSSVDLSNAVRCGVEAMEGNLQDYGLLTTPQLHFMVRCKNTDNEYGTPTEEGYYKKISEAFIKLRDIRKAKKPKSDGNYKPHVTIDAANGIGAPKAQKLKNYLADHLTINICNDGSQGKLNFQCGADYVKVQQRAPVGITMEPGTRYLSYDGDADRIVYYSADKDGKFHLLDGDKIATLVASYLKGLVEQSGISLNLGLVQTAYANGSSTDYITQKLGVPVACVPTGVKHLHHRAQQFDVGVYFEANGHGTVLFSQTASDKVKQAVSDDSLPENKREIASQLSTVIDLINQTVGDAISDLLLVETVLAAQDWDVEQWDQSYTDLPNRQLKVQVKDRSVIQTADAERKAVTPEGLQTQIDVTVAKYKNGRSFVRPSGTEDVVRVYAEANSQENADNLAFEVAMKVYELAGGVGNKPQAPQ